MKEYQRKNVSFDLTDEQERTLWEWLKTREHGEFAKRTKTFWAKQMEADKNERKSD